MSDKSMYSKHGGAESRNWECGCGDEHHWSLLYCPKKARGDA